MGQTLFANAQEVGHAWQVLHPPLQAWDSGWLDVGDEHRIWWEQCGHPGAPAALFVHGGPGAGCTQGDRRWFHPQHWRTVLFDQRGCGRSLPMACLQDNDTGALVADMEKLRRHLGIERWLLFGGSWGSTLALAYAQAHPQRVSALVLRGIFLATRAEREWLYGPRGAALRHPAAWQRLCAAAGAHKGQTLLDAMHFRLQVDDAAASAAAHAWRRWEHELMDADTSASPPPGAAPDDAAALCAARIGVHFARAGWFIEEGMLLRSAGRLRGLPAIIVQGQRDLVTPPSAARALHAAWPGARLVEVPGAGHGSRHPAMARHLIQATEALAQTAHLIANQETRHGPQQAPA